ncbi:MAG: glycosyltransferase family 2 protein [Candidatus Omnitrophica bacterium]|nr:glycosyltransferase family 2 protein [Candidatus Omnitrophota bacterium]
MSLDNKRRLIIVPVHNEEENIRNVISDIKTYLPDFDLIFINDCSNDNTAEIIEKLNYPVISSSIQLGYGGALQLGFKYAVLKDYDLVMQFDGDGQHLAEEAKKMYEYFSKSSVDILIGSRFIGKSDNADIDLLRRLGIEFYSWAFNLLFKKKIYDITSGLQILSKRTFSYYAANLNYPEDYPDVDILAKMHTLNYSIEEFGVRIEKRRHGKSMHSAISAKTALYLFKVMLSLLMVYLREKRNIKL